METWRGRNAAQWLGSLGDSAPDEPDVIAHGSSAEAVLQLASEIRSQHASRDRQARWRRYGWAAVVGVGVAAAAAAALLVVSRAARPKSEALVELRAFERQVTLDSGAAHEPVVVGHGLNAGQTIITGSDARAVLAIVEGGSLALGAFSDLGLMASEDKHVLSGVRLGRGRVEVDLPKLSPGRTFDVTTPDTQVRVVGTKFEVRVVEGAGGPLTCVSVTRGSVRVVAAERAALLVAGQRWASRGDLAACDLPSQASVSKVIAEVQRSEPALAPSTLAPAPLHKSSAASSAGGAGTLAEENRLFLELVRARREGRNAEASTLQHRFLARYPSSVLAPQVLEEQRRTDQ